MLRVVFIFTHWVLDIYFVVGRKFSKDNWRSFALHFLSLRFCSINFRQFSFPYPEFRETTWLQWRPFSYYTMESNGDKIIELNSSLFSKVIITIATLYLKKYCIESALFDFQIIKWGNVSVQDFLWFQNQKSYKTLNIEK